MIWAQILRELGNLEADSKVKGGMDLLGTIMTREGMRRMRAYLHDRPEITEMYKRRIFAAFLDKYAIEEALEEELDIEEWTPELIARIEEAYDADVDQLSRIPDVRLLTP